MRCLKGGAYQRKNFNVFAAKRPKPGDATGHELKAPVFKFTLTAGKKGESIKTKLPEYQCGIDGKWHAAVKKESALNKKKKQQKKTK